MTTSPAPPPEHRDEQLTGATFHSVDLSDSRFEIVDFARAFFRNVYFEDALIRGAWLSNVDIDGVIDNVSINGVDIGPLVEAELDRRDPDRAAMRAQTAQEYRAAWSVLERLWASSLDRAASDFTPEQLHERVQDEWSFTETVRHLVFVVDAWLRRALLGEPAPYDPLDLTHDEHPRGDPALPHDPDARPDLPRVRSLLEDRMRMVRDYLAGLTDDTLAGETTVSDSPGYPEGGSYPVRRCLRAVVNEFYEHRRFAERDLAVLAAGSAGQHAVAPGP